MINVPSSFHSPVKFVGGDCWLRGPALTTCPSHPPPCSVEQPMEVSTVEQMDTSSSGTIPSEASAPLPIKHPPGISTAPYKKHVYPMNSKRPEHLRMNLWRSASLRKLGLIKFLPSAFPAFLIFSFTEIDCRSFKYWLTLSMLITSFSSRALPPLPPMLVWTTQPLQRIWGRRGGSLLNRHYLYWCFF